MAYELRWLEWRPQYPSEREKFHYKSVKTKAEGQKLLRDMKKAGRSIKFSTIEKVESNPRKPVQRMKVRAFRDPTKAEIAELVNLWHLSRVPHTRSYDRMIWTSDKYAEAHPEVTSTWAYKALERQLAGLYAGNPRKYKRVRFKVPAALRRMRAGALHATIRPKANPPARGAKLIGTRLIYLEYSKAGMVHNCDAKCKAANHCWKHSTRRSTKACIWGLPDGSVLISL